ncbi:MAG: helix-turn-helix domain-containing GNAT family N-acetyltransferase [Steroidobacteraceae bacterium]
MTDIQQIRAFNRTVTRRLGVLNERYLGRHRPLAESRLLYEIGAQGAPVREVRARLGLDSGFVSRMLRNLERKGLAATRRRSDDDGRVRFARLTRSGLAELRRLNALSDDLAQSMLSPLSGKESRRLVAAMSEVERLLRASSVEIAPAAPASPDAHRCLNHYFAELATRFPEGYDRGLDGADDLSHFAPPRGSLLVARLFGEPVGCAALRTLEPGIGEIKRMWVAPAARGLGIGRRLLNELERVARRCRLRAVQLDTNGSLKEALRLYRSSGYREIGRFNDNPYAQHWFEKALRP